jgi:hypothetical protein
MDKLPKSYLPEEEKARLTQNGIFLAESMAGDEDASWAWLAQAKVPDYAIKMLGRIAGRDFLRSKGFHLEQARPRSRSWKPSWLPTPWG